MFFCVAKGILVKGSIDTNKVDTNRIVSRVVNELWGGVVMGDSKRLEVLEKKVEELELGKVGEIQFAAMQKVVKDLIDRVDNLEYIERIRRHAFVEEDQMVNISLKDFNSLLEKIRTK